jgi:hypothetical protein
MLLNKYWLREEKIYDYIFHCLVFVFKALLMTPAEWEMKRIVLASVKNRTPIMQTQSVASVTELLHKIIIVLNIFLMDLKP